MRFFLALLTVLSCASLSAVERFQVKIVGSGPPMILIPGLSSPGDVWDSTVEHYRGSRQCHVLTVAGFAGVPGVEGPVLAPVRDALADYIRAHAMDRPTIVGHSLGGYWALALASQNPSLVGPIVVVDAYPFFPAIFDPDATPASAKADADRMHRYMSAQSQEMYERYLRSGVSLRPMVGSEEDLETLIEWGLASDRTTVATAMAEMYASDLRDDLAAIETPALVLGAWIGYKQFTDRERTLGNLRRQYARLEGVRIEVTDVAGHFIMWDDPDWMFERIDEFLDQARSTTAR